MNANIPACGQIREQLPFVEQNHEQPTNTSSELGNCPNTCPVSKNLSLKASLTIRARIPI